ncbi:FkbM family methyltransferase [Streptomyces sp. NPDC044780]|uniref:FkbM family methyltransferase n=1 Tax=unclassified Streptomyces TaxID=2593676 RepID=UPI0033CCE2C6
MPLAITLPLNPDVLRSGGPYPRALNVLGRKQTAVRRQLRRAGLADYEPTTQATLLALVQQAPEGCAVYDIGAHIGLYSALISAVYGDGGPRAVAFEPTPETAALCRRIRDCNRLGFEVQQTALADEPGTAELHFSHTSESSNSLNPAHRKHTESVTVPVTTVDAFTGERGITPYLIKIDVETFEAAVLRGSYATIRRHRPWIVCELLPGTDHDALRTALTPLTAMDYGLHPITPESPLAPLRRDHLPARGERPVPRLAARPAPAHPGLPPGGAAVADRDPGLRRDDQSSVPTRRPSPTAGTRRTAHRAARRGSPARACCGWRARRPSPAAPSCRAGASRARANAWPAPARRWKPLITWNGLRSSAFLQ